MSHQAPRLRTSSEERKLSIPARNSLTIPGRQAAPSLVTIPSRSITYPKRALIVSHRTNKPVTPVIIQSPPSEVVETIDAFELLKQQLIEEGLLNEQAHQNELSSFLDEVATQQDKKPAAPVKKRFGVALLIAAHDEALVIENTIRSAIKSGQDPHHIYVVDDNSTDDTSKIARTILPKKNVKKVSRSGKGLALMRGTKHFKLTEKYEWVHIADADGAFSPDYFTHLTSELDPEYAAATGYIKSLPGGIISQCRVYEYSIGMELMRRFQDLFGVIPIIPGATSVFRSDVFDRVDFNSGSMTEDFDVTVQIHREKMGKIQFIPDAIAYTQDPKDLKDYIKQVNRWNRGFLQVLRHRKIGRKFRALDMYINYQLFISYFYLFNIVVWTPLLVMKTGNIGVLGVMFVADVITAFAMTFTAATIARRYDILNAFPFIYGMRWLNMFLFFKAIFESTVLRKYRTSNGLWDTAGRRYKPTTIPQS